jgi:cell division septal protein FtsQ
MIMRHAKWLKALCVAVVIAFTALCVRAIFSVSDIEIDQSCYNQSEVEAANELLSRYYGAWLPFVKTSEITDIINNQTGLKVESIEKQYPNVLQIKLKERQERFAIKSGDSYLILDDEYTVVDIRDNPENSVDGLANILLVFENSEFSAENMTLRSSLDIGNKKLLDAVVSMIDKLDSPRDTIKEIRVEEKERGSNYYVNFETLEGVTIEIRKALERPAEKITAGIEKYLSLSDRDRLIGKVAVYALDTGEVVAIWTNQNA